MGDVSSIIIMVITVLGSVGGISILIGSIKTDMQNVKENVRVIGNKLDKHMDFHIKNEREYYER